MNEVTVSTLPHPISMFLLGFFTLAIILMFIEYLALKGKLNSQKKEMDKLVEKMESHVNHTEERLMFISKKVDSRVDKALLNSRK